MGRIGAIVVKEIREALPATIFFLFLFHMIGLTKDVALDEYSFTALRSAGATLGALIVAKAILVVEALPMSRLSSGSRMSQVIWKTLLYGVMVLLFRFVEELIPFASKHDGLVSAIQAMFGEVSWALFTVLALWILGGLFLYCLASELVQAVGPDKIKEVLFSTRKGAQSPDVGR
jgi:fumarate reductase subunit D